MGRDDTTSDGSMLEYLLGRWRKESADSHSAIRDNLGRWLSKELVDGEAYEATPVEVQGGWEHAVLSTGTTHESQGYHSVEDFLDAALTGGTVIAEGNPVEESVDDRFMEICEREEARWLSEQPVFGTIDAQRGGDLIRAFAEAMASDGLGHEHWRTKLGSLSIAELRSTWPVESTNPLSGKRPTTH